MNMNLTTNQRLALAGIKTIRTEAGVFLSRNGITTPRPNANAAASVALAVFNVVI